MVDVVEEIGWLRLKRKSYYTMIYSDVDGLAQKAVGNANWSAAIKKAYNDVQDALEEEVQERAMDRINPMQDMPGMPGFGMPGFGMPGFGVPMEQW